MSGTPRTRSKSISPSACSRWWKIFCSAQRASWSTGARSQSIPAERRAMSARARPPFRADQVGSLLRPAEIKKARAEVERGEMSADKLREIEDRCIREAVARQESLGLQVVTDGEYRRGWWNHDFLGKIDGVEIELDQKSYKFAGSDDPRYTPKVRRRVRRTRPMMLEHFRYLKSVAKKTPKFTMPSPSILYHRGGRSAIDREAYPDLDQLWSDVGRVC